MNKAAIILVLALGMVVLPALAQPDNGGPGGGGPGGFVGGPGGGGPGGGPGGGGFGGGNFDPAQMQQMMMDRYRTQLNITNDTDWAVIQPLIQKVTDARTAAGTGRGGFGGGRGGGGFGGPGGPGGGPGGPGQTVSVEQQALQNAIDNDAPAAQIKDALEKFQAAKKTKQAALTAAQEALRQVLSAKQEAQATLLGLLP